MRILRPDPESTSAEVDTGSGATARLPKVVLPSGFAIPLTALVLLLILVIVLAPAFYSPTNLSNVGRQAAILGVVAIGQTYVMLVRGIDLSVGAVMGVTMIIVAQITSGRNDALAYALILSVVFGIVVGLANAFLVIVRRVPPFVTTLTMLILIEGAVRVWTGGIQSGSIPPGLRPLGIGRIGPITTPLFVLLLVAGLSVFVLRRTVLGRAIYATGGNPVASRLSGIRTRAVTATTYVICSTLAVLAGLMLSGYIGYTDQYLGQGFELDSIAAAMVGGASFFGGRGSVLGTLFGVAVIAVLLNLIVLLDAGVAVQLVVKGAVIIGAITLQRQYSEQTQ